MERETKWEFRGRAGGMREAGMTSSNVGVDAEGVGMVECSLFGELLTSMVIV